VSEPSARQAPPQQQPEPPHRAALPRTATVAALAVVVGVAVALLSASPTWLRVTLQAGGVAGHATVKGRGAAAAAVPLALVAAAGLIALALVRGWVRRLLGILVLAAGAGVIASAARVLADPTGIARGDTHVKTAGKVASVAVQAPPYLTVIGGALVVAGAVLAILYGGGWPSPARRYERAAARAARPKDDWEALEQGDDPTVR
jgi:uncharacterized membrane protein (TIGR02234 family)